MKKGQCEVVSRIKGGRIGDFGLLTWKCLIARIRSQILVSFFMRRRRVNMIISGGMKLRIFLLCMCGSDLTMFLNVRKESLKENEKNRKNGSLMEHCTEEGNVVRKEDRHK